MRRLLKIVLLSLTMSVMTIDASAQPPVPAVPAPPGVPAVPSPARVVRDVDAKVRRATPVRRRVRRGKVRRAAAIRRPAVRTRRAGTVTLRPPVRGLPTLRLPKPPIPR